MYVIVSKETRLNIRISPLFKDDLQRVADFHGLTVSSYVHSVLVKQIRLEKEREPEAFVTRQLAPVVATIKPTSQTKQEIAAEFKEANEYTITHKNPGALSDEGQTASKRRTGSDR